MCLHSCSLHKHFDNREQNKNVFIFLKVISWVGFVLSSTSEESTIVCLPGPISVSIKLTKVPIGPLGPGKPLSPKSPVGPCFKEKDISYFLF